MVFCIESAGMINSCRKTEAIKNLEKGWKNIRIKKTASTTPVKSDIEAVVINQEDCLFGFSASTHFM